MAKKATAAAKSDPAPLSPSEAAREKAKQYLSLIERAKQLTEEAEELKAQLVEYARNNDDFNLDVVTVEIRSAKPKLDFGAMTKKAQEQLLERLKNDLPEFVVRKAELDVESMYFAQATNAAVQNALKANGVQIVPTENCAIRKVK